jgi:KaiC/GvpD/RAD55 family RecA-like ATPase
LNRAKTGVKGLDEMLNGGLPSGRSILVCGGPGSGKTIFGLQFLLNGIDDNENGLFVSLDESLEHIREDALEFGWALEELERQQKLCVVDASPLRTIPGEVKLGGIRIGKRDFSMMSLMDIIKTRALKIKAKRVVVDGITNLIIQYPQIFEQRMAVLDLLEAVSSLGSTNIFTGENRATTLSREVSPEEFLCHGVIVFHVFRENGQLVRAVQIEKMRGMAHDQQIRPYRITNKGIRVYNQEETLDVPNDVAMTTITT